jgi:hypothetical protein
MADVQDDVHEELLWDLRALAAADQLTDTRVAQAGVPLTAAGLYPSLHLNLCECYHKLGDDRAREHLRRAEDGLTDLGDDDYGRLIRDGLRRLTRQLSRPADEDRPRPPPRRGSDAPPRGSIWATTFRSTLPNFQCEKPDASVVPISARCTVADAAAGLVPMARSSVVSAIRQGRTGRSGRRAARARSAAEGGRRRRWW